MTILTFAALAIGTGKSASAAQLGPYVGGSFGITDRDLDIAPFDAFMEFLYPEIGFTPTSQSSSIDSEGQGFTALIGYRINAHLAVEGMFVDSGKATYRAEAVGNFFEESESQVNTKLDAEVDGIGIYALGIWPLSYRWEVYGRAGVQFSSGRLGGEVDGFNGLILEFARESSTDLVAGMGVAMSIMEIYGARLEFTRIFDAGSDSSPEADADMLSLGVIVAF